MKKFNDFDLTKYNSYNLKSFCSQAFFPDNEEDVINFFKHYNKYHLIGSGHNIILAKQYYEVPFLIFNNNFNAISLLGDDILVIEAGATMLEVSEFALANSLTGLEMFYDIPSSLGGAIYMNAGAGGEEIKDILIKVRYYDLVDFKVKEMSTDLIDFDYRNSFFQKNKNKIVLNASLKLKKSNKEEIKNKMETIKKQRWSKQPREFPNAGSAFKRPKGFYVGKIMQDLNLRGYSIGGAKISEKHGGFIVNFNNATGDDIIKLINFVKSKVFEKFGINLEVEQRVI